MKRIVDPLSPTEEERGIVDVLRGLAAQENCDGEPYDQMQMAADYIQELHDNLVAAERKLEAVEEERDAFEEENDILKRKEEILYRLARLARNTDGLHPSTQGPEVGSVLLDLRLLDGGKYAMEVM